MKQSTLSSLVVAFALTAGLIVGFIGGNMSAHTSIDWKGWIGALSGWAAALTAGATIFVLLYQTKKSEEITHKREIEAKQIFVDAVMPTLVRMNRIWRIAEDIIRCPEEDPEFERYTKHFGSELGLVNATTDSLGVNEQIAMMTPKDKSNCMRLLEEMKEINRLPQYWVTHADGSISNMTAEGMHLIALALRRFINLLDVADQVDPNLRKIFKNRQNIEVKIGLGESVDGILYKSDKTRFPIDPKNPY